jgi:hypothetical protein
MEDTYHASANDGTHEPGHGRTWYRLGAKDGDRAAENSIVGRVQTVF